MIRTKVQQITETNGNGIQHKKEDDNKKAHKSIYIIFISLLLDLLAFTIILPLLPTILERYRQDDSSGLYVRLSSQIRYFQEFLGAPDRYSSVLFGGFLGSMFSFLQFVASPIMGALSDCYGRKPILLLSLVSSIRIDIFSSIFRFEFISLFLCSLESHVHMSSGQYRRISFYSCWHALLAA